MYESSSNLFNQAQPSARRFNKLNEIHPGRARERLRFLRAKLELGLLSVVPPPVEGWPSSDELH